ncbi:MAG: 3-dehydroquinate synthase [Clostridia bacterium]|nr:3-dehydroquinate synthase [Clostridia bacterium]
MVLNVKTQTDNYNIILQRGAINRVAEFYDTAKKALIVTDSGVPFEYAKTVSAQFSNSIIKVIPQGEKSKCFDVYKDLLEALCENEFSRSDCVVAVGGGVVGDLSGFCASTYMRGIDFVNIPTTVLSQVDSSIGGKTAIDFSGYKNIVGAFYPPKVVIIDSDVLKTLPQRHINNGLVESIKMAAACDKDLFEFMENNDLYENVDKVIEGSLRIKKYIVEEDEKEQGLRKVLNFGHTAAHAIETATGLGDLLHGECVAIGMLAFSSPSVRARLTSLLKKYNLPTEFDFVGDTILEALRHDKKSAGDGVNVVYVNEIGSFEFKFLDFNQLDDAVKGAYLK